MSRFKSFCFVLFFPVSFGEVIGRKYTGVCLREIGTCGEQNNGPSKSPHLNPSKSVTMLIYLAKGISASVIK